MLELFDITKFVITGLIYGIATIGVANTMRYLRTPDFSWFGSLMMGGVIAICTANWSGFWGIGICSAILIGMLLGSLTTFFYCTLKSPLVLAGIVTYTFSSGCAYLCTDSGVVALQEVENTFFGGKFDVAWCLGMAVIICIAGGVFIRTKLGSLVLAMLADDRFVMHRHRYANHVRGMIVISSNGLVALSGALFALKDKTAYIQAHGDFLTVSMGSFFGISIAWVLLKQSAAMKELKISGILEELMPTGKDDTKHLGWLYLGFFFGAVLLCALGGICREQFNDPSLTYFSQAGVIALAILTGYFAQSKRGERSE